MSGGGRETALDEWVHPLIVTRQRRQASRAFVMRYVRQMNFPVSSATFHEGDREDEVRRQPQLDYVACDQGVAIRLKN